VPFKSTVNDGKYLSFWLVAQEIFGWGTWLPDYCHFNSNSIYRPLFVHMKFVDYFAM
jgi:hypothetical protein